MSQVLKADNAPQMGDDKKALLQVVNLRTWFQEDRGFFGRDSNVIKAVDDVSFDVSESEFVSIVGESGSGKTTIARCIMGITSPSDGSILLNGKEVTHVSGSDRLEFWKTVQMIYQDPFESLNPRKDVFATLSSPLKRLTGEKSSSAIEDSVVKLLQEVGLNPSRVMRRYPHQLSGGEKQRVNIARALAPDPKLLIADEPITMLDAAQRYNIISLLMGLRSSRKLSVLMITHDMATAKVSSDRILVMYLGKLVEEGEAKELFSRPHHPYTELILSSTPGLQAAIPLSDDLISTGLEESLQVKQGCVFRPRCKYATEICATEEPKLLDKTPGHSAACHNALNC
ncbi:MAG: ABC transporter ATP-binding protein [Thaumarchaeota archaeon]|nr:ABC transporter ATP-binding protein [Nitrososphaerota archaeon]